VNRSAGTLILSFVWPREGAAPDDPLELMHQQPSDDNLIFKASRARDGDAMTEIVRRYAQLAYAVGHRVAHGDDPAAERVARQCVVELATAPHRVRGELSAWLHGRATAAAVAAVNGHAAGTKALPHRDPAEEPRWEEVRHAIDPALSRLAYRHRHVIIQHYFQRHSQDELAEMLQVTQPVVARRLRRALEKLRTELVRAGAGCSLAQLMMLLARHAASDAPPQLVDELAADARHRIESAPRRRGRFMAGMAIWSIVAGMIAAVAMSYATATRDGGASGAGGAGRPAPPQASKPAG
jgi:RNA polymerase sigma factor (sigma-70 family)